MKLAAVSGFGASDLSTIALSIWAATVVFLTGSSKVYTARYYNDLLRLEAEEVNQLPLQLPRRTFRDILQSPPGQTSGLEM